MNIAVLCRGEFCHLPGAGCLDESSIISAVRACESENCVNSSASMWARIPVSYLYVTSTT